MKIPNMGEWPFRDVLKATSLVKEIGETMSANVVFVMLHGEMPPWDDMDDGSMEIIRETLDAIREESDADDFERFVSTIQITVEVGKTYLDSLTEALEIAGATMPDPDTVVIPDEVPKDWGTK